jgi:nucleoside-diphosphate-sugar epimerase
LKETYDIETRCGDIRNTSCHTELLKDIDIVYHAAAYIPNDYTNSNDVDICYEINAQATRSLAVTAKNIGVKKFIYFSTGNMYTGLDSISAYSEESAIYPSAYATPYFSSKLIAELYLADTCRNSDMQLTILRIGTPYGPGEPDNKVIPKFLKQCMGGKPIIKVVVGSEGYNFVYIDDVIFAALKVGIEGHPGIFNIASRDYPSIKKLAQFTNKMFGFDDVVITEVMPVNIIQQLPRMLVTKAVSTFEYNPLLLEAGLHEYLGHLMC